MSASSGQAERVHGPHRMGSLAAAAKLLRDKGVSRFLCKRRVGQWLDIRSSNWRVKRVSAAFQSRIGIVHF